MFCGCELSFGEPPNTRTCPVCLGLPGTLPVVNAQAVHFGLMMGLALECEIAPRSIFHRKNYFYPDQAKNYQISQYDIPLCRGRPARRRAAAPDPPRGGRGEARPHRRVGADPRRRRVDRRLQPRRHAAVRDRHRARPPLGRAGARLAQPAARHAAPARRQRREHGGGLAALRRQRLRAPGRQHRARDQDRAQEHELVPLPRARRQRRDRAPDRAARGAASRSSRRRCTSIPRAAGSRSLRSKEEAHDYRYFPEPDLVPLVPTEEMLAAARAALPELPAERAARYERDWGLARGPRAAARLRAAVGRLLRGRRGGRRGDGRAAANWVDASCARASAPRPTRRTSNVTPGGARRARRAGGGAGRSTPARRARCSTGWSPRAATRPRSSSARASARWTAGDELAGVVAAAIAANEGAAEKVRGGNDKAMGPIVGFVMRETKGRADGGEVGRLIREQLGL